MPMGKGGAAVSKSQQRLMGMVRAYEKGELKDAPDKIKEIAKSMKKSDTKGFAKTKHKGLPEKIKPKNKKKTKKKGSDMYRELAKLASELDAQGLTTVADQIDEIIKSADSKEWMLNKLPPAAKKLYEDSQSDPTLWELFKKQFPDIAKMLHDPSPMWNRADDDKG